MTNKTHDDDVKALLSMTAETVGRDLLQALVQEIKLLPDVWPKMSQKKQDSVIDRLRNRIETNVKHGRARHRQRRTRRSGRRA